MKYDTFNVVCLRCVSSSSSSRSLTRPVQKQWWSWWSSSGPPSPHIIFGEADGHCAMWVSGRCFQPKHSTALYESTQVTLLLRVLRFLLSCCVILQYKVVSYYLVYYFDCVCVWLKLNDVLYSKHINDEENMLRMIPSLKHSTFFSNYSPRTLQQITRD